MSNYMEESLDTSIEKLLEIIQDRIMKKSTYFGVQTNKNPTDFWVYQEIIFAMKPDVIVEIGNKYGGATLALAHLCDLMNHGKVIGVDITHNKIHESVFNHPRITLFEGDACLLFDQVQGLISKDDVVLVIEDSSHTYENTLNVLNTYSPLIKKDGYFIVEDGICHHGLAVGPKPGPYEAVEQFVRENQAFEIDRTKEDFLITWNPKGFLRRKY